MEASMCIKDSDSVTTFPQDSVGLTLGMKASMYIMVFDILPTFSQYSKLGMISFDMHQGIRYSNHLATLAEASKKCSG